MNTKQTIPRLKIIENIDFQTKISSLKKIIKFIMSSTQSADLIQFGGDRDDNAMKIDSGIVVAVEAMESESTSASVLGQTEKNITQVS